MNKKIVIDGRQLVSSVSGGVQRSIKEIVNELDKIASPGEYEILIPKNANIQHKYKNITVIKYGILNGLLWEQICLPFYLLTRRCYGFFPCTVVPMLYPKGIAVVHDIMVKTVPMVGNSLKKLDKMLLLINYRAAVKHSDILITDSEFSKNDIEKSYQTSRRIEIVPLAWQHIQRVDFDDSWMERFPKLKPNQFYFSLSANRKQKNFKWIYEIAKNNPSSFFAIAGTEEERQTQGRQSSLQNIVYLGYVSDGNVRSLMYNCKAFLFPSICEGFGMPPMEALASGAKIIISNTSCLPEIYQDSAYYIDPYDYNVDLDELLKNEVAPPEMVLERFGWDKSARKIYQIAQKLIRS